MKPTAKHRRLELHPETIRSLQDAASIVGPRGLPQATTLSACRGGCKADSRLCSL